MAGFAGAAKESTRELYKNRAFWGEAALAVVPWAANTAYHLITGDSSELFPYAEVVLDAAKGPLGAHVATSYMKHLLGRDLTPAENITYSAIGGAGARGLWAVREAATNAMPYLSHLTPDFSAGELGKNMVESAAGGVARSFIKYMFSGKKP